MHFTISMLRIEDMSFQEKDVQIKYPNIIIHVYKKYLHILCLVSSSHNLCIEMFPTEVECEDDQKVSIFTAASISAVSNPTPLQSV